MPFYKPEKHELRKKAIPEKLDIRNLIREESKNAVKIILASDSDPSGDFIAWSIADDLRHNNLYRGNLQALSKTAVVNLIKNATLTDHSRLRKRLENRYLIRQLWKQYFPQIDIKTAALVSIFGTSGVFTNFKSEHGNRLSSLEPIDCEYDTYIKASPVLNQEHYRIIEPLSTFKVLELYVNSVDGMTLSQATEKLNTLFTTTHPHSDEGLITYPRTSTCSFFEDSWETIKSQWVRQYSLNDCIPSSLHQVTHPSLAHDSIRPTDLTADPDYISKHIPFDLGELYKLIYDHTIQALSMPVSISSVYHSEKFDALFTPNCGLIDESVQLQPCLTLSDFGIKMNRIGVLQPSDFASFMEKAQNDGFIELTPNLEVKPGRNLSAYFNQAERFKNILTRLKELAEDPDLEAETISGILTS